MSDLLGLRPAGSWPGGRRGEGIGGALGEPRLVALDGDHIVAAPIADRPGHAPVAVQRISADRAPLERQKLKGCDRRLRLAALARHRLGQAHEGRAGKHRHHQRRHVGASLVIGPAQALAVDRQLTGRPVEPGLAAEGAHEAHEGGVERHRVERRQNPAEGVMAGRTVLERNELPQQVKPRAAKQSYLGAVRRAAKHRRHRHKQNLRQLVLSRVVPRVRNLAKNIQKQHHDLPHQEGPSESFPLNHARHNFYSCAIPLL